MATITINETDYNSYATVEEANKYFNAKFGSSWADILQEDKQKLLVTATREMEKVAYKGIKENLEQDLEFPRIFCCVTLNPEKELAMCCAEIANAIYNLNTSSDNISTPNAENIKSMSVGDTSITYKDGANIETDAFTSVAKPFIKKFLGKFLTGNIRIIL